jgi:hypothetical protein
MGKEVRAQDAPPASSYYKLLLQLRGGCEAAPWRQRAQSRIASSNRASRSRLAPTVNASVAAKPASGASRYTPGRLGLEQGLHPWGSAELEVGATLATS